MAGVNPAAVLGIPECPQHGHRFEQRRSVYGIFWRCPEFPCDWRVGAHQDTGRPLGTPADSVIREARKAAHQAFDPLWTHHKRGKVRHRLRAYAWLARQLEMPVEECHIARFDRETCERVVRVCAQRQPKGL